MSSTNKKIPVYTSGGPGVSSIKIDNFKGPIYSVYTGKHMTGGVPNYGTPKPGGGSYHGVVVIDDGQGNQIGMAHYAGKHSQTESFGNHYPNEVQLQLRWLNRNF